MSTLGQFNVVLVHFGPHKGTKNIWAPSPQPPFPLGRLLPWGNERSTRSIRERGRMGRGVPASRCPAYCPSGGGAFGPRPIAALGLPYCPAYFSAKVAVFPRQLGPKEAIRAPPAGRAQAANVWAAGAHWVVQRWARVVFWGGVLESDQRLCAQPKMRIQGAQGTFWEARACQVPPRTRIQCF